MAKVMMTIRAPQHAPSVDEIRARYRLDPGDLDETFGVIAVDPQDHSYTILVEETAAPRILADEDWKVSGPFSNPRIEPFWPPK